MKIINYKNIKWIVLKENNERKMLITKDILPKEIMRELTGNDSCYCKFSDNTNEYDNSYIKTIVEKFVDKYLDKKDLVPFSTGRYARLLNAKEVLLYDNELMRCNDWYWTSSKLKGSGSYVWYVYCDSALNYHSANFNYRGVRPVIYLNDKYSNPKKMTLKEICDELGYEVEIVKE